MRLLGYRADCRSSLRRHHKPRQPPIRRDWPLPVVAGFHIRENRDP